MKTVTVKIDVPVDTTQPLANQIMRHIDRFNSIDMPAMIDMKDSELDLIDKMDRVQNLEPGPSWPRHYFTV